MLPQKIIFVSAGGTSRSPMAAAIARRLLAGETTVLSKGLVVLFPEPVNQKAEAVLASHGLSVKGHRSEGVSSEDFEDDAVVITMEAEQKNKLEEEYVYPKNIYTISDFDEEKADIKSLIGGTLADYGKCYEHLEKIINNMIRKWKEEDVQ